VREKRKRLRPLWQVLATDLLLTLLILGGWLLTRWVSVRRMADTHRQQQLISETAPPPSVADSAAALSPNPGTDAEQETAPQPDDRTPWQLKFAEHFTPEVSRGEWYYTGPDVSVCVTSHTYEGRKGVTVYYVADIYIADIEYLQSWFACGNDFPSTTESIADMSRESGALIAVNGDYCGLSYGGTVLRNGKPVYSAITGSDVCLLYRDGRMECPALTSFDVADYQGDDALWQVWTFGPALLDGNGRALSLTEMNRCSTSRPENPRTALGYYEPGHYCFIVADGRDANYSAGLWLDEFAEVCALTGCAQAYNMDGGGSSMMVMDGEFVNRPSSGGRRGIPDIILIRESADKEAGE